VFVCILPKKAVPEMIYTLSGRTLNPTHSLTHLFFWRFSAGKHTLRVNFDEMPEDGAGQLAYKIVGIKRDFY